MIYRIVWVIVLLFLKITASFRVQGKENQIASGPVVVVSNHSSNWDPLAVGAALNRKVHYMAKEELFRNALFGWFLKQLGVFPVKRGSTPKSAIVESLKILKDGKMLGIFPEGTRSKTGELQKPNQGAVILALKVKAPILPVALIGTKNFKGIRVIIGQPISLEQYFDTKPNKEKTQEISEDIMEEIKKLLTVNDDNVY